MGKLLYPLLLDPEEKIPYGAEGRLVKNADIPVTFRYGDFVRLLGTGNGDPADHDSVRCDTRRTFSGRLQAIFSVRGAAGVRAESPGVTGAEVSISFLPRTSLLGVPPSPDL